MNRQVLPHEVRDLLARMPRWWSPFLNWSLLWANHGWRFVPHALRRLPLRVACFVLTLYARGYP